MKYPLFFFLCCYTFWGVAQNATVDSIVAFIGRKIQVEEWNERSNWLNCAYKAQYEVAEVLKGNFQVGDTVDFVIWDHEYCPPLFTLFEHASIMVKEEGNGEKWILRGEHCVEAFKTIDGDWATRSFSFPLRFETDMLPPYPLKFPETHYTWFQYVWNIHQSVNDEHKQQIEQYFSDNYSIDTATHKVSIKKGYLVNDRFNFFDEKAFI